MVGVNLPERSSPCVLLVEDNVVNQDVTRTMLESFGLAVDLAADGWRAIEAFRQRRYAAILMDCQMPELSGFDAARIIRTVEGRSRGRVPIIAVTAGAMAGDRVRCLEAGMDDYLAKPFTQLALRAALDPWLPPGALVLDVRQHGLEPASAVGSPESEAPILDPRALDRIRDLAGARGACLLAEVIALYLRHAPAVMADLRSALVRSDRSALARGAHTLKSSSSQLGANALAAACGRLELLAARAEPPALAAALARIEAVYRSVADRLGTAVNGSMESDGSKFPATKDA